MDGLDVEKFNGGNGITGFPVLFIKGEKSDYIGLEDEKAISTLFPYAEIETIPDTGHWLHAEKPERFLQTIQSFLGE
jgi:pimeloyl-ACP methyl ester carboxylesterase